jgi:eukaryotic-like serine/threonine-protein kinase
MSCPAEDELLDYCQVDPGGRSDQPLASHVAGCEDCQRIVAVLEAEGPSAEGSGLGLVGQLVGNYRVLHLLGSGGMGEVYVAEHPEMGRRAAVKIIRGEAAPEQVTRFFAEARAAASIKHPHIVDVFDMGRLPTGAPYILMELLEGETLGHRLRKVGRLGPDETLEIASQAASALEAVHARGITHRDLKPENVFLSS